MRMLPPRCTRTDGRVDDAVLREDCNAVLDTLEAGGVAIIPTCLTYAIVGHRAGAIAAIFAAKARSYSKPCGLFGSLAMSREVHDLPADKHEIMRVLKDEEELPFSIVAPFRRSQPLLARLDPFVVQNSSKDGTMDMVVSGGPFVAKLAELSLVRGIAAFGSSANRSLGGSKYRLSDVEPEVSLLPRSFSTTASRVTPRTSACRAPLSTSGIFLWSASATNSQSSRRSLGAASVLPCIDGRSPIREER